jgi:hypothetical protein
MEYEDSMGVKKSEYIKESGIGDHDYSEVIKQDNLLDLMGGNAGPENTGAIDDLLGTGSSSVQNNGGGSTDLIDSLLDLGGASGTS